MHIKEIRHGNYYHHNDPYSIEPVVAEAVGYTWDTEESDYMVQIKTSIIKYVPLEDLSPIPITEEFLRHNNFTKESNLLCHPLMIAPYMIAIKPDRYIITTPHKDWSLKVIRSIHQLQNAEIMHPGWEIKMDYPKPPPTLMDIVFGPRNRPDVSPLND